MNVASVKDIKAEIEKMPQKELVDLCLRLVKFKKESKELATYLLFEKQDEEAFIMHTRENLSLLFEEVNRSNLYFAKKTLRKIVRVANRYVRYSAQPETEVAVLIFVAEQIKALDLNLKKSTALENIYLGVLKKINKTLATLHEDLQYDYLRQLDAL
jgi:hypothetical protein